MATAETRKKPSRFRSVAAFVCGERSKSSRARQKHSDAVISEGQEEIWAGLDSNQRRRKASRFTVCPVWPLRYLPLL
jgi:hypothetical protein